MTLFRITYSQPLLKSGAVMVLGSCQELRDNTIGVSYTTVMLILNDLHIVDNYIDGWSNLYCKSKHDRGEN